jgi:uncharacterized membrane protein YsdA (DUF1294 family)
MSHQRRPSISWATIVAAIGLLGPALLCILGFLPTWVAITYVFMSLAAFAAYGTDKAQAGARAWRVPERVLHLLSLFGGWPGALAGQRHFRHKTQKARFQAIFWSIVAVHVVVIGWWCLRGG